MDKLTLSFGIGALAEEEPLQSNILRESGHVIERCPHRKRLPSRERSSSIVCTAALTGPIGSRQRTGQCRQRTKNTPRRTSKARLFQLALEVLVEKLPQPVHEDSDPRPGAQVDRLTRIRDAVVDCDTAGELHRDAAGREQQERVERYLGSSSSGHAQILEKKSPDSPR